MNENNENSEQKDDKVYWLDQPKNINLIVWALVIVSVGVVCADLFYHKHSSFEKAGHHLFDAELWFGFYGFYGFISCVFLVLAATQMRKLLMREEDYYDR
ncbi:MAG TPA: hypothetical protein DCE42_27725 [Myxococcales bacterium]|nr:hypothetical protein [Deltaproteobacteria bacterium]HAA58583.1 hypothetical protein [Myxococcales bacterium]|tara:strand:+ start:4508 stop:4807 length:300 start_codon:yes stop_codon:yes gene_type:complete